MLLKNERCGKYELLEKLASGGMADIYLARSVSKDGVCKFVAIKRIQPQLSRDQDFVNMFREESKIAISLNHNNIVSVLDLGYETGQYFLVMEYVEGYTLKQICTEFKRENKTLSIEQIIYLIKEVAAGLDYAHQAVNPTNGKPLKLIHRDISPQNIMIAYHGAVKVIDFGIAQVDASYNKGTETLKGKFRYMSPEQAEMLELDARSDIFSLGVVLWELLTNDHLFNDKNDIKILQKVKACQIPSIRRINPGIPVELERIVTRALTKDRNLRYQTAAEMSRDLNRLLNHKFPEFSQQEFALTIKTFFKDEYKSQSQKLIEYTKLPWEESEELIVFNPADSEPSTASTSDDNTSLNILEVVVPDQKSSAVNSKINFSQLLEESVVPESVKNLNLEKDFYALSRQSNMGIKSKAAAAPISTTAENRSIAETLAIYAIVVLALSVFYYSFKKYFYPAAQTRIERLTETRKNEKKVIDLDSSSQTNVNPEKNSAAAQMNWVENTKKIKIAYLNIKISGESSGVEIKVNGMLILDKPPIYMYPVVADKETVITAYDPATQRQDEKKLIVEVGKSADVLLSLKSE